MYARSVFMGFSTTDPGKPPEFPAGKGEYLMNVLLIDAFSQIFRCYFAITGALTNGRGEPTNAVFGFARLLMELEREFHPEYGALCFDCGKPEFRLAVAPDYKAGRPPMPEDLAAQLERIRRLAALFGWPVHEEPDYEADDLIGGFARAVAASGGRAAYISQDKDLAQLIDDNILWYAPDRKNSGFERRDGAAVAAKFGVAPEGMVDYLSLLGDASDHIPGIPGVGAKTASRIVNSGIPVEEIAAGGVGEVPGVPPRLVAALRENAEVFRKNRRLITLRCELPERLRDLKSVLKKNPPDWQGIAGFCREQNLRTVLTEIPDACQSAPAAVPAAKPIPVQQELF